MKRNDESCEIPDTSAQLHSAVRDLTRARARQGTLAVLMAAAVLALAACSGAGNSPQVATLGNTAGTGGGGSAAAQPKGNPTRLLDEWAVCMRSHGDPNQTDPTIDSSNDIEITMTNVSQSMANAVHGSTGPCSNYLVAASIALNGGKPQPKDSAAQDAKYADCMRAHGFPNWPNAVNGETNFSGTGIDPLSPAVDRADKVCRKQAGPYYVAAPSMAGVVQVFSCTAPPGVKCPAGPPSGGSGGNRTRPVPSGGVGSNG